jgi:NADH-quinone oxidoreductase subunit K
MHIAYPAVLAALLFSTGLYGVLARRNAILMLMSVELMLNAVNLNLVAFDAWLREELHTGQALALFTIAIAAAEIGIGLAIVLLVYRTRGSSDIDRLRDLREGGPDDPGGDATDGTRPNGPHTGTGTGPDSSPDSATDATGTGTTPSASTAGRATGSPSTAGRAPDSATGKPTGKTATTTGSGRQNA